MFWDASYYAGHTGPALAAPATQWYFAEGAQGFFDTFVLVNNPNAHADRRDVHVPARAGGAGRAAR